MNALQVTPPFREYYLIDLNREKVGALQKIAGERSDVHVYKEDNETVAEAFRTRLKKVAQFMHVPQPLPMRNSRGATIDYFFFASQKPVANRIIEHIFDNYRKRGIT